MSTVTIIGGHGKVALLAAPLLVEAGHRVRSVIRNAEHSDEVAATGAEPVIGDIETMDLQAFTDLLAGSDAVVFSAGAGGGSPERTRAVDHDAAVRSMEAAAAAGADRYLMVSYFGAGSDEVPADNPFHTYATAKADADQTLRGSSLDWTILGPSSLTLGEGTGTIAVGGSAAEVSRANVARVVAAALADDTTIGRWIPFNDGDTPIAEAIAAS